MRSTFLVGGAAAALLLASAAAAQTTPAPAPAQPAQPEATNPATGPATPAQPTTTTPPFRGAATTTAPAGAPRLEAGAKVVGSTGAEIGQVVSVDRAADGSISVDLRTSAGVVKTLPVAAFGSRNGAVATTWTDAQISAAPAGKIAPVAPPPASSAAPATSATPAQPGVAPATPSTPATPAKSAATDEGAVEDEAEPPVTAKTDKPRRAADRAPRVGKPRL